VSGSEVTVPGASDLGDGIAQIRLPMAGNPLRYINGYVVEDEGGLTLVDCGWKAGDVLAALHAGLHELGHDLSGVQRILITHHHFDH
jgi:glyoxylase-like metal-dependent hydrolase (beta-lactamase superfamily II)